MFGISNAKTAAVAGALLLAAIATHLAGLDVVRDVSLFVAAIVSGIPTTWKAIQALRYKAFSIDLLVTIAVLGALIIGEYVEAAVVSFLFVFGAYLDARTLAKTRKSVRELVNMAPLEAVVRRADSTEAVPVDEHRDR